MEEKKMVAEEKKQERIKNDNGREGKQKAKEDNGRKEDGSGREEEK